MAFSHARDFLFCKGCGTQLLLTSPKYAKCPLCGGKRRAKDLQGKETRYSVTAEDIRRSLNIEPFVQVSKISLAEVKEKRTITKRPCPNCHHPELEYYSRQLRSADEGQTQFYNCTNCGHQFQENSWDLVLCYLLWLAVIRVFCTCCE